MKPSVPPPAQEQPETPTTPKRGSGGGKQPNSGRKKRRLDRILLDEKHEGEAYEDSYIYAIIVAAWIEGKTPEEWVKDRAQGQIDYDKNSGKWAQWASRYHHRMREAGKLTKKKPAKRSAQRTKGVTRTPLDKK